MDEDCVLNAEILMQSRVPVDFTTDHASEVSNEPYFGDDLTYIMESGFINEPEISSCTDDDSETDDSCDTSEDSDAIHAQSMKKGDSDTVHGQLIKKEENSDPGPGLIQSNSNYRTTILLYSSSDSEEEHVNGNKTRISIGVGEDKIKEKLGGEQPHCSAVQDCAIIQNLVMDTTKILQQECQIGCEREDNRSTSDNCLLEEENVNNNKTMRTSIDEDKIKENFSGDQSHCIPVQDCAMVQNSVTDTTKILQQECQMGCEHTDNRSSSDNSLPENKGSSMLPSVQGKAQMFSNTIPIVTNDDEGDMPIIAKVKPYKINSPESIVKKIVEKLVEDTTKILEEEKGLLDYGKQDIIVLTTKIQLNQIGFINGIVEKTIIVQSNKDAPALDADSSFFLEDRVYMGKVLDTFGPVKVPYYTVHLSSRIDASNLTKGTKVFFAPFNQKLTKYVFMEEIKKFKGSDASWRDDFETPLHLLDYSDDEEERGVVREENIQQNCGKKSTGNIKTDINVKQTKRQYNNQQNCGKKSTGNINTDINVRQTKQQYNNQQNCGKKSTSNIKTDINVRQTQRKSNFFRDPSYNQTRNRLNGSNIYSSNVPPFASQFSQQPRLFNNFAQMTPPFKNCEVTSRLNNILQELPPSIDILQHQQLYLPPQNFLSSNIQPPSFPFPFATQSPPPPLYIPPERFTIINNQPFGTGMTTSSSHGNVPIRNGLPANVIPPKSFINSLLVTSQPSVIPASPVLYPFGITSHQNSLHPPAVNALSNVTVLPTAQNSRLPVSLCNSSNMFPANSKHGEIVNLNGFTLMR